jgi:CubicO group peptidase (beta-lactamase class C family)
MRRPVRAAGAAVLVLTLAVVVPGSPAAPAGDPDDVGDPAGDTMRVPLPSMAHDFPGEAWARSDPEDMGFDAEVLAEKVEQAGFTGSSCFAVVRRGRLVGEWYWHATDPADARPVYSVTKSVTSTLVGIAQADGLLDIDDRASQYIPAWRGTPSQEVTIRQLLSNTSGRHWDYFTDYGGLDDAEDANELAIGLDQDAEPGTTWVYNNAAIQALDVVLSRAIGGDVADFAQERLFDPIGMRDTEMTRDGAGNTRLNVGLRSTCGDLARFGYLFLRGGNWAGEQVVPAAWVAEATGRASGPLNAAYGLLWWLNQRGSVVKGGGGEAIDAADPEAGGDDQMAPGSPEAMFWAIGLGDQVVQVDPDSETVLVRMASDDPDAGGTLYPVTLGAAVIDEALVDP